MDFQLMDEKKWCVLSSSMLGRLDGLMSNICQEKVQV